MYDYIILSVSLFLLFLFFLGLCELINYFTITKVLRASGFEKQEKNENE